MTDGMLRIGIDFDGVIADCTDLKREQSQRLYGIDIPPHRCKEKFVIEDGLMTREQYRAIMENVCTTRECGLRMRPIEGAIAAIRSLQDRGHSVKIVTSREDEEVEIAREWSRMQGLDVDFVSVGYGKDKTDAVRGMDIYIDDDVYRLRPLEGVVGRLFLMTWEYNRLEEHPPFVERVDSWDDLSQRLEEIFVRT